MDDVTMDDVPYTAPPDLREGETIRGHRELTGKELLRARRLGEVLGVDDGTSHSTHGFDGHRRAWSTRHEPMSSFHAARALRGDVGVSVAGLRTVRHVTIDLDMHTVGTGRTLTVEDVTERPVQVEREGTRLRRGAIAKRFLPVVRAIRAATPGVSWIVTSSPRGLHVTTVLDRARPVDDVRAAGLAVLERAGLSGRPDVEVFPKVDAEGSGRTCRLPMTESSRLLRRDLSTNRYRTRAEDVQELLSSAPCSLELLHGAGAPLLSQPIRTPDAQGQEITGEQPGRTRVGSDLHEVTDGHLKGEDFAQRCAALGECIGRGESWEAARRFSFLLLVSAGMTHEEATACFKALLDRDGHRARSVVDPRARGDLLGKFKGCLRYAQVGIDEGRLKPGRMRRIELRALVGELRAEAGLTPLAPVRPSTPVMTDAEARAARRAAARKGWETRRLLAAGERDPATVELEAEVEELEADVARCSDTPRSYGCAVRGTLDAMITMTVLADLARARARLDRRRIILGRRSAR